MYTWLIATSIVLILLWLAWRRPNRQRLVLRMVASAVAGISLVLLVFTPATKQAVTPSTAILLTQGYSSDTLQTLLEQQEAKPQLYYLKADNINAGIATPLSDLYTLRQEQPELQTIHLLGYGLEEQQLKALEGIQVIPHLSEAPAGVRAVQWPQEVKLGEAVSIAGKYKNKSKGSTWLYLQAAGQLRDSAEIKPDSLYAFTLRYTPKQVSRSVYTLLAKTDAQIDTLGQMPVQVTPQQQLRVLLLASTPLFEFKFLKNHLAEQQHKVAYRATVSRDISQMEWLNMQKTNLKFITPKLLQNFDLVITEPQALQSMSASERATLQHAVTESGLGVLTIATELVTNRSTSFFTSFQSKRASQQDTRSTKASWAGSEVTVNAAPYTLVNATAVSSLVTEKGNNGLLAGARRAGWGKVAISYLPQTFPWLLADREEVYASYWTTLLSTIAKEQVKEKFWQIDKPQVPHPNQPVNLTFTDYTLTEGTALLTAAITSLTDTTSINLPLAQNTYLPEKYSGTFWPTRSGWHQIKTPNATPFFFYVQDTSYWTFEDIAFRKAATEAFAAQQNNKSTNAAVAYREEPVSLIWFFMLFVLSSGFLWLEEKL